MFTPVHSLVFYIVRYSVSSIIRTCVPPYTTLQQEHARARWRLRRGTLASSGASLIRGRMRGADGTATGHARPRTAREASRRDVDDEPLARIDQADHRLHHSVRSVSTSPGPESRVERKPEPARHAHGPRPRPARRAARCWPCARHTFNPPHCSRHTDAVSHTPQTQAHHAFEPTQLAHLYARVRRASRAYGIRHTPQC